MPKRFGKGYGILTGADCVFESPAAFFLVERSSLIPLTHDDYGRSGVESDLRW